MNLNNKWIYFLLILLIIMSAINLWISGNSIERNFKYSLHRDSTIQLRIDSIMQSVNDFRTIYSNDRLIADNEHKIINNYVTYNQKKNELLQNPIDSVYNWTKHKLNTRAR